MEAYRPLLSICIPTYNRAEILTSTVKELSKIQSENIEIVISDNCSSDDTKIKIKELNIKNLIYSKNDDNYGFTYNFIKVIDIAKGKYTLLLSDEDSVNLDSIPQLLEILETNDYAIVLGSIKEKDGSDYLKYQEKILKKGREAFWELGYSHSYVSGIILKKDLIDINYFYNEYKKKDYGLLDVYPHQIMLNKLCYLGDVKLLSDTITLQREIGRNYAEELNKGETYVEPNARYNQFVKQITYLQNLDEDIVYKIEYCFKLLEKYLSTMNGYIQVINDKHLLNYYGIKKRRFNVKQYIRGIYPEIRIMVSNVAAGSVDSMQLEKRIKKTFKRSILKSTVFVWYCKLKIYKTPFHKIIISIRRKVKTRR